MNFANEIIKWYFINKRDLPWRHTVDPYLLWLSEIILQQTRVNQGLPYYEKFVEAFPTVTDLALASEETVLRLWQGLGYYSRARNLHFSAKYVVSNLKGVFPSSYHDLLLLKGVGKYTAAAIASFAENEPYAVLDGNVFRVLSRYFGVNMAINSTQGVKQFEELAQELLPVQKAGLYNQAIMEFGALQCKPAAPNCDICPLLLNCEAFKNQQVNELPIKLKKVKIKERFFNYFIWRNKGRILMRRRDKNDIWQHLYDFPCIEIVTKNKNTDLIVKEFSGKYQDISKIEVVSVHSANVHKLTHQHIFINFFEISASVTNFSGIDGFIWVKENQLDSVPMPRPITKFLLKL